MGKIPGGLTQCRGGVLEPKKRERVIRRIDTVVLTGMVLGIVFLFQPFSMALFTIGFPLLIVTYVLHSVFDHL